MLSQGFRIVDHHHFKGRSMIWGAFSNNGFALGWCQWLLQVRIIFIIEKVVEVDVTQFLSCGGTKSSTLYRDWHAWEFITLLLLTFIYSKTILTFVRVEDIWFAGTCWCGPKVVVFCTHTQNSIHPRLQHWKRVNAMMVVFQLKCSTTRNIFSFMCWWNPLLHMKVLGQ